VLQGRKKGNGVILYKDVVGGVSWKKSWGVAQKYLRTLPFYTNFDQVKNCNYCPFSIEFLAFFT